jgi:hypothetical protein
VHTRRRFEVFSLSFLDVMSCGFGAVVLLYLIMNHASEQAIRDVNDERYADIRKLDFEMDNGQVDLADLERTLADTKRRIDEARNRRLALDRTLASRREQLTSLDADTLARIEHINRLKSDVDSREKEVERLKAKTAEEGGDRARVFVGEGDRQYLTGLKVGGKRVLIALDTSASMLDETIVNVLRRRNMDEARRRAAPKWRRAVATVEWIAAQLPLDAQFQIYGFADSATPMLAGSEGRWLDVSSPNDLEGAVTAVAASLPAGGTNLYALATAIDAMRPAPDNLFLVVDGLPTRGERDPRGTTVSGRDRVEYFADAVKRLPADLPVNVILLPMEGDPAAAASYWGLAHRSMGSFLSPSADWP